MWRPRLTDALPLYDVFAKLRYREPASEVARLSDQPVANRILEDPDYRLEDDA